MLKFKALRYCNDQSEKLERERWPEANVDLDLDENLLPDDISTFNKRILYWVYLFLDQYATSKDCLCAKTRGRFFHLLTSTFLPHRSPSSHNSAIPWHFTFNFRSAEGFLVGVNLWASGWDSWRACGDREGIILPQGSCFILSLSKIWASRVEASFERMQQPLLLVVWKTKFAVIFRIY